LAAGLGGWVALAWAAPVLLGLCLAIPYAVVTASPAVGAWAKRAGLCAVPEEIAPAQALLRLAPAGAAAGGVRAGPGRAAKAL
jgi:membrane glycosyltransferase